MNAKGSPTLFQRYFRKISGQHDVAELVYAVVDFLKDANYLVDARIGPAAHTSVEDVPETEDSELLMFGGRLGPLITLQLKPSQCTING